MSAFHSAIRGGHMFSKNVFEYLSKMGFRETLELFIETLDPETKKYEKYLWYNNNKKKTTLFTAGTSQPSFVNSWIPISLISSL
jgi:hypothetical protein